MRGRLKQLMAWKTVRDATDHLSHEQDAIVKDWGGRLPFALVYPNSYYLGMSNLGVHAIYRLLNDYGDVVCERVFWETGQTAEPVGTESGRPLADYAVLAFSVTYELDYLNVPRLLRASGIPVYAADRDQRHPLVIAGGACITANPMPLAPFFDCLCIGEAEAILPKMLPVLSEGLRGDRQSLLNDLAAIPGVFVPGGSTTPVARQWLANLDDFPVATAILTPDTELGNLYLIEVERGCGWGCRFCLVSNAFRPARYRSLDILTAQAKEGLRHRKRLGLVGPAVTDHPRIEELVTALRGMGAELSISSLRVKPLSPVVLDAVIRGGARTIALAPEAGSERLRRLIHKGVTGDDVLSATAEVASRGLRQLKLYFMVGLPSETDQDVAEIARLTQECKAIMDRERSGSRVTVTVSAFIPKAGTPFQWLPMAELPVLEQRLSSLKGLLEPRGIRVKHESLAWSEVQAVLARGDDRLAGVLAGMTTTSRSAWRRALADNAIDADRLAHRAWPAETELPWAVIDQGTPTAHLQREADHILTLTGFSEGQPGT